jgi:hypothetical protein
MKIRDSLQHNAQFNWISQIKVFKKQDQNVVVLYRINHHHILRRLSFDQFLQASNRLSISMQTQLPKTNAGIFLSDNIPVALNNLTLNNLVK